VYIDNVYVTFEISVGRFSLPPPVGFEAMNGPAGGAAAASVSKHDPNVKVQLENEELWSQFHQIGTEMIITKMGRSVILIRFVQGPILCSTAAFTTTYIQHYICSIVCTFACV
jgi:hypothetical protein